MSILLTGFEPFSKWKRNPSFDVINSLNEKIINHHQIISKQLPVKYLKLPEKIEEFLNEHNYSIIIMTGMAEGSSAIRIEKVAINEVSARIPYKGGAKPIEEKIIKNGPDAFFTGLPALRLVKALKENNIPARVSYTAGTYACNQAFYYLMYKINSENNLIKNNKNLPIIAGFIHLPITPDMAASINDKIYPSMDFNAMVKGMKIMIEELTI